MTDATSAAAVVAVAVRNLAAAAAAARSRSKSPTYLPYLGASPMRRERRQPQTPDSCLDFPHSTEANSFSPHRSLHLFPPITTTRPPPHHHHLTSPYLTSLTGNLTSHLSHNTLHFHHSPGTSLTLAHAYAYGHTRAHTLRLRLILSFTLWTRGRTTLPPCFYTLPPRLSASSSHHVSQLLLLRFLHSLPPTYLTRLLLTQRAAIIKLRYQLHLQIVSPIGTRRSYTHTRHIKH